MRAKIEETNRRLPMPLGATHIHTINKVAVWYKVNKGMRIQYYDHRHGGWGRSGQDMTNLRAMPIGLIVELYKAQLA